MWIKIIESSSESVLPVALTSDWGFEIVKLMVYGARPIRRWLERKVVTELSRMLVKEEIDENSTVYIDAGAKGSELVYRVEKNGGVVNVATGQKSEILIQIPNPNGPKTDAAHAVKKMKKWNSEFYDVEEKL